MVTLIPFSTALQMWFKITAGAWNVTIYWSTRGLPLSCLKKMPSRLWLCTTSEWNIIKWMSNQNKLIFLSFTHVQATGMCVPSEQTHGHAHSPAAFMSPHLSVQFCYNTEWQRWRRTTTDMKRTKKKIDLEPTSGNSKVLNPAKGVVQDSPFNVTSDPVS